mgnify:CR=1 FL=1
MTYIAWHFTGDKLRDGSPIPPIGHTLVHTGEIEMCASGYHWSRTPFQALPYAPGPLLHKVRIGGTIRETEGDKGVSSERTILATIDATQLMRRFAADQALSVAHLWPMPDVVREYLVDLDEAKRSAAWSAAMSASWSAESTAESAARSAAWSATNAAWSAASAAWSAARSAASAARSAAWSATNAAWRAASAARSAASAAAKNDAIAAESAARSAALNDFNSRVYAAFEKETV